ncbi:hypothetical protein PV08_02252 [Exophiala spinifera]|uniref:D-xylose reductase [NAD(P)H] n=1 Tax=Exophiala spinifera TaxID=91928 RepID=A0A0D2AA80_9EURO|nr:uncharacterized protein PV08_02252 [Exophiala spinifera]KIW21672.1 hypothetical protein PV08_02252 [Exophiala spinifera]
MSPDTIRLATGHEMPLIGFGLWKIPSNQKAESVYNAIKIGYRLFDGAYDYQNEKEAGEGIRRAINEGIVTREDVFVTTKLWNNYHRREHALVMAKAQNDAWGLGYIDLYLIHFPIATSYIHPESLNYPSWWMDHEHKIVTPRAEVPIHETWQAIEEAVDAGIVRSIGISNAQAQMLYDIQTYARHPISSLQIDHHPYLVQQDLVLLSQEAKIALTAYSSFGPQSFLELPPAFRARAKDVASLFDVEVVKKAAAAHQKTAAQVLLRWATQRNIAVIPKSNNPRRLQENLEVGASSFDLTKDEIDGITALDRGLRFNDPGFYLQQPLRIFA